MCSKRELHFLAFSDGIGANGSPPKMVYVGFFFSSSFFPVFFFFFRTGCLGKPMVLFLTLRKQALPFVCDERWDMLQWLELLIPLRVLR